MKKKELKKIAMKYGANVEALKVCLQNENLKLKEASYKDVIKVLMHNAPNLLWTRNAGELIELKDVTSMDTLEYLDNDKFYSLINEYVNNNSRDK